MRHDDARQLLNRTGFAADLDEIEAFTKLSRNEAVEKLLARTGRPAATPPPAWAMTYERPPRLKLLDEDARKRFRRRLREQVIELRNWWITEMLTTSSPFTEKMTLFWHNHFTSSIRKVRSPVLMYRQNHLLRHYAFGNFRDFLHVVAKDPAMMIWLDTAADRKRHPNENFSREVMELFTLGLGHYTQRDVTESARAYTGWSIDRDRGEFVFRPRQHDDGPKTFLGRTGNFNGDEVLDIILDQPAVAGFITAKLWRHFVSLNPDPRELQPIARRFRESGYDIKVALRGILASDAFYAPRNRAVLFKSPVDFVVGTLRQFRFDVGDATPFSFICARLGQNLFAPPNVAGWPGGEAWINSNTLLARKQFLGRIFRGQERMAAGLSGAPRMMQATANRMMMVAPKTAMGGIGRRITRGMTALHFDEHRWFAQFEPGDRAAIERVIYAGRPVQQPRPGATGVELLKELTLDPMYELI
ncbi:MAG TPA: DUF1800 domain-containing protein [Burkholderiales bacterium]|nr:DUF1800 domain-containing protein [Burkholderiales bacterium]